LNKAWSILPWLASLGITRFFPRGLGIIGWGFPQKGPKTFQGNFREFKFLPRSLAFWTLFETRGKAGKPTLGPTWGLTLRANRGGWLTQLGSGTAFWENPGRVPWGNTISFKGGHLEWVGIRNWEAERNEFLSPKRLWVTIWVRWLTPLVLKAVW